MQLIFETERAPDIKSNMSNLEESVGDKLITNAIMDSLKHISNGNKENIQAQDNISRNEKNGVDSIKLDDEELSAGDDMLEEVLEERLSDEEEENSNPEVVVCNDQPGATESNDEIDDLEKILLKTEQEDTSNSSNKEEKSESEIIEQVNDILAQKASDLINKEREEVREINCINEDSQDDTMKAVRENLFKSIEIKQVLEEDSLTEDSSQENCAPAEEDATLPENNLLNIKDKTQENQFSDEVDTADKVSSSVVAEAEIELNDDSQCLESKRDKHKQDTSDMGTVPIQDDHDEVIGTAAPESMDVDEVSNETDITSDKEENVDELSKEIDIASDKEENVDELSKEIDIASDKEENADELSKEIDIASDKEENMDEIAKEIDITSDKDDSIDQISKEIDITSDKGQHLDEISNDIEITSDKEDNEITLLDSPVGSDIDKSEIEHSTSMDCDIAFSDVDKDIVTEVIDNDVAPEIVHTDQVTDKVNTDQVSEIEDADEIPEIVDADEVSEVVNTDEVAEIIDTDEVSEVLDTDNIAEIVDKDKSESDLVNKDAVSETVHNAAAETADNVSNIDEEETFPQTADKGEASEIPDNESTQDSALTASQDDIMIIDKLVENSQEAVYENQEIPPQSQIEKEPEKAVTKNPPVICRLSNNLDILSDDEDEPSAPAPSLPAAETPKELAPEKDYNNDDDDVIMLLDEDTNSKDSKTETSKGNNEYESTEGIEMETDLETGEKTSLSNTPEISTGAAEEAQSSSNEPMVETAETQKPAEQPRETEKNNEKPLLADNFLKLSRKNIADMTREDLEEFCILKIVESIVDRSNLSEIKTKLKAVAQNLEDYKKKAMMLTKQNQDLEIVLNSVQEELRKTNGTIVTPMKITRSVGMQVYMTDKALRKKLAGTAPSSTKTRSSTNGAQKATKTSTSPTIPVPRLIPANNAAIRGPLPQNNTTSAGKQANAVHVNGVKNIAPAQKPEKRSHTKSQSVTVDLTDDEPPTKVAARGPVPPVRLVPSQNLLAPQRPQYTPAMNTPRKVYIPISGPQGQQIKPGQTIMLKTSPTGPNRQRGIAPTITRLTANQIRMSRQASRHPAALPDVVKQYQPPNWKALPPAPDLKLSKVENGIVISWKIEGYDEDTYEEIASYQLYAYQETSCPPSTALWKKIGDVKALPLPMACTLTQFMAGFKYYFAVRAVDVKSRVGPFSMPGSILLLNKM